MTTTVFTDFNTPIVASWLNDVNTTTYTGLPNEVAARIAADAAEVAALAASTGSSLVGHIASGAGAVARSAQSKLRDTVSVKDFGATGDGVTDDTAAIQTAITASVALGKALYVPSGTYKISSSLLLPTNCHLIGESRNISIISGITATFPLITLLGNQAKVSGLCLRDGSVGVQSTSGVAYQSQIIDCKITYNRIGILIADAFITLIKDNCIFFNQWGIVSTTQNFQVIIRDNIIDNNLGGGGILAIANSGLVISGNTIEGNRLEATPGGNSVGYGLWIIGLNQRCIVTNNWLEDNGNQDGSTDILIGKPTETWVDVLFNTCVPVEYQALMSAATYFTGQINIRGNFFYKTKRFITAKVSGATEGTLDITNSTFVGFLNKYNRSIELYGPTSIKVTIANNTITNTGNIAITPQMNLGVKLSYVYYNGAASTINNILFNGVDLFTAYLSTRQFAALSGASLDTTSRVPSSGNTALQNGKLKALNGILGTRVIQGTGRPRAGSIAWFNGTSSYYVVVLATGNTAGYTYQASGSFIDNVAVNTTGQFNITLISPISAEAVLDTGDYYGWAIIPTATFEASVYNGCTRMTITDLGIVELPLQSSVIPTSYTSASQYNWNVGDTVYNTAPASAGYIGWVCTVAGSPGTWKTFGLIS